MLATEFLTYNDKFIVMLDKPSFVKEGEATDWYLKTHTAKVLANPAVRRYLANVSNKENDETIAKLFDSSFCSTDSPFNPWNEVKFVDEVYAPHWEDVESLYVGLPVMAVYAVTEYHVRQLITDRPLGVKSPEIKRFCVVTKSANLTHDEAVAYQILRHPAKCFIHHSGMACYTQNHVNQQIVPGPSTVDNFTILHFWNLDAVRFGMFSQPDSRKVIGDDCANFRSTTYAIHTDQYIMKV